MGGSKFDICNEIRKKAWEINRVNESGSQQFTSPVDTILMLTKKIGNVYIPLNGCFLIKHFHSS